MCAHPFTVDEEQKRTYETCGQVQHKSPQDQLDRRRDSKQRPARDADRLTDEVGLPSEFPSLLGLEYAIDDQSVDRSVGSPMDSLSMGSASYDSSGLPESTGLFMESPPGTPPTAAATTSAQQAETTPSRPRAVDANEDTRRQRRDEARARARELVSQSTALGLDIVGSNEDSGVKLDAHERNLQGSEPMVHENPNSAKARAKARANARLLEDEGVDNTNSMLEGDHTRKIRKAMPTNGGLMSFVAVTARCVEQSC